MVDYHPVSFHFRVSPELLINYPYRFTPSFKGDDIKFQSVSGLNVQLETESYNENGENGFPHILAKKAKYPDLVLKRGVFRPGESGFTTWCKKAFEDMIISPINLTIELLNEEHNILMFWDVKWAWPKEWKVGDLNAEKGEILIETLVLSYNRFELKTP